MISVHRGLFMVPLAVFLLSTGFHISRDVLLKDYDADLDHHMYFGQRLLYGELIWTYEIYDKFPVIQYLFAIPAFFESMRVWFIMSAFMLGISAVALYVAIPHLFLTQHHTFSRANERSFALLCACFYLFLSSGTPPGLAHINVFSTSNLVLSCCFIALSLKYKEQHDNPLAAATCFVSAMFASIAVSIRPFLGPPAALLVAWLVVRHCAVTLRKNNRSNLFMFVFISKDSLWISIAICGFWLILTAFMFLTLNFAPYISSGKFAAMTNGIMHNSQKLNPQTVSEVFSEQYKTLLYPVNWIYVVLGIISVSSFLVYLRLTQSVPQNPQISTNQGTPILNVYLLSVFDMFFAVLLPLISLELMVVTRHWWGHYLQMYIVPFVVSFGVIGKHLMLQAADMNKAWLRTIRIISVSVITIGIVLGTVANQEAFHPQSAKYEEIVRFLQQRRQFNLPVDFLDLGDMYPHWKLHESRHGFPHAQNIQHIVLGWYTSLHRMNHLVFPYTREELCTQVNKNGPTIIFLQFSYMFQCLLGTTSQYTLDQNTPDVIIFIRTPTLKINKITSNFDFTI